MKQRKHHKVGKTSIHYNPALDARWPMGGYFARLGLFALAIAALASWCLIVPPYVSPWPRVRLFAGIFAVGWASAALVLAINPTAIPLADFRSILSWTSPPGFFWKIARVLRRFLTPSTPNFFKRFRLLLYIEISFISWNGVLYLAGKHLPFSRDWLDSAVVFEIVLAAPFSFLVNRLIDWKIKDRRALGQLPVFFDMVFFTVCPARQIYVWVFRPIVLGLCRLGYRRFHEPRWLD